ncbi:MAG: polyprenyl synthetase family protein [Ruminococcus sp.]|jgi:geranylgeranyl diphosphate synthase type II|nr:polyprenyl synthetase family protein [Ruminococcus sp.]
MVFNEQLDLYINTVQSNLRKYNSTADGTCGCENLIKAMNYSLEAGGKRIRPVLVYEFCRACGGNLRQADAPAAAIEMIHTFSLIHDDLPAMDNDDYRRGRLSCHKAFDEATAILAGDALSVLPFEIIADADELSADKKIRIISCLSKAVGREGMIGGQVIDMENESLPQVSEANLRNMYRKKTGALIMASCVMGCICAGASDKLISSASEYAYNLGLAFQIVDDILDVTSTQQQLGKPIGSDAEENKTTFVTLFGVEKAKEIAASVTDNALKCLESFEDNSFLIQLTEMLLKRNK